MATTSNIPVPKAQAAPITILITGAARGIGYELVQQYAAAHPGNVVFAAVRNVESATALASFAAQHSNVHIVPLDVADQANIHASVAHVSRVSNHLDVLINNAGIIGDADASNVLKATSGQLTEVFNTNVAGVLTTTQVYLPLLQRSTASPKVVNVSSTLGSNVLANMTGQPVASYGLSKSALNYLTTAFRYAVPSVTFLSIHPGWVATDMGNSIGAAPTSTRDSVQAIRYHIAEKGIKNSGDFFHVMTGEIIPY